MPLRRRHWIRKSPARVAAGAGSSRKRALPAVLKSELRLKLGVSDQRIKTDQHHGERQEDEGGTPPRRLHISSHRRKLREVPVRAQIGMLIIAAAAPLSV
jgi:hypothetical protein